MSKNALQFIVVLILLSIFLFPVSAEEATECDTEECHITITVKIAFVGPEATTGYMDRVSNEIETEWNGDPFGTTRTYGDCECPFKVDVITDKVENCDSAQPGYHCVEVTDYDTKPPFSANESVIQQVENGSVDPRTSDQVERHRGYMDEVSNGGAVHGWWSDIMSTPTGSGDKCLDFAHEAGHLMGLEDGDGGIMDESGVCGSNAGVTRDNIDDAVEKICGDNACPDRCCCGNGKVDSDKNEECDPLASSTKCQKGESCCPICCSCFAPCCNTSNGEYATKEECEQACTGKDVFGFDMTCHLNYHTGCWDCVGSYNRESTEYQNDTESIWKANESIHNKHVRKEEVTGCVKQLLADTGTLPIVSQVVANERMDIYVGEDRYYIVTVDGEVMDAGEGGIEEPTVNIISNFETVDLISSGELGAGEAYKEGKIIIEGVGFINSVRIGFINSVFDIYSIFSDLI